MLNIIFLLTGVTAAWAMVAPIKDKSHSKNLTGTFARPKISLNCSKTGNFYNWKIKAVFVIPTLDCSISFDCMHAKDVDALELCLSCTESLTLCPDTLSHDTIHITIHHPRYGSRYDTKPAYILSMENIETLRDVSSILLYQDCYFS